MDGADDFGQQLSSRTDKWLSLLIFFETRPFAHKYKSCGGAAGTENNVTAMLRKPAPLTISQL
jgi:ribosomal 50S subunit-recycling heat shock protein